MNKACFLLGIKSYHELKEKTNMFRAQVQKESASTCGPSVDQPSIYIYIYVANAIPSHDAPIPRCPSSSFRFRSREKLTPESGEFYQYESNVHYNTRAIHPIYYETENSFKNHFFYFFSYFKPS